MLKYIADLIARSYRGTDTRYRVGQHQSIMHCHDRGDTERRDLFEVVDERHGHGSTIITSQLPIENWHDVIGDPTIADGILDRLIHNAHKIKLKGGSMRKKHSTLT